eukprot:11546647-Ditylum_brightwellii.AAC.1
MEAEADPCTTINASSPTQAATSNPAPPANVTMISSHKITSHHVPFESWTISNLPAWSSQGLLHSAAIGSAISGSSMTIKLWASKHVTGFCATAR